MSKDIEDSLKTFSYDIRENDDDCGLPLRMKDP